MARDWADNATVLGPLILITADESAVITMYTLVALQMWPDFMSHISACCQLLQMTNFKNCIFNQHILITSHLFHHLHISSFSVIIVKTIFELSHKEQLHLQPVLKVVSGPVRPLSLRVFNNFNIPLQTFNFVLSISYINLKDVGKAMSFSYNLF